MIKIISSWLLGSCFSIEKLGVCKNTGAKICPAAVLYWKASPNVPHDRPQHITGCAHLEISHLNHHLNYHLLQPLVLWWQIALATNSSAAAKLLPYLQHWWPEPWQYVACSHCMGKIVHPYRGNGWRNSLCSALLLQESVRDWEEYLHVPEAPEPGLIPDRAVLSLETLS